MATHVCRESCGWRLGHVAGATIERGFLAGSLALRWGVVRMRVGLSGREEEAGRGGCACVLGKF